MPPNLKVTWADLWAASVALRITTDEARALPRTNYDAFAELDMKGSRTSSATAEFLADWGEGLEALAEAGEGLSAWLEQALAWLGEIDAQLAAAAE
jgi:hypothetical protein